MALPALPRTACFFLTLALLLAMSRTAVAQQSDTGVVRLTGHVVDSRSGQPLAGATIAITSLALQAVADDSGRFQIPRIPRGRHQATVRRIGYDPYTAIWDVRDGPHVLTVALGSRPVVLQGVTVRGYGVAQQIEQRRRSTGVSSVVYARRDLDRSAAGDAWSYLRPRMMNPSQPGSHRGYRRLPSNSGGQIATAFYVDEMPADREWLESIDLEQIYSIEIYGGRHVRVYTLAFIEARGNANRPLFPLSVR